MINVLNHFSGVHRKYVGSFNDKLRALAKKMSFQITNTTQFMEMPIGRLNYIGADGTLSVFRHGNIEIIKGTLVSGGIIFIVREGTNELYIYEYNGQKRCKVQYPDNIGTYVSCISADHKYMYSYWYVHDGTYHNYVAINRFDGSLVETIEITDITNRAIRVYGRMIGDDLYLLCAYRYAGGVFRLYKREAGIITFQWEEAIQPPIGFPPVYWHLKDLFFNDTMVYMGLYSLLWGTTLEDVWLEVYTLDDVYNDSIRLTNDRTYNAVSNDTVAMYLASNLYSGIQNHFYLYDADVVATNDFASLGTYNADTGMIGVIGTNLYKRDSQTVDGIYVSDIYEIKNDGSTYTKVCRVTGAAHFATLPS